MTPTETYAVTHVTPQGVVEVRLALVPEVLLTVHVQGRPYASQARTPGHEEELVTGMCFVDGLIDTPADLASLDFFPAGDRNRAEVCLTETRHRRVLPLLEDRTALRHPAPMPSPRKPEPVSLSCQQVQHLTEALSNHQKLRAATAASHAVGLFDATLQPLSVMEDLGRHNAFDKAIGDLVLQNRLGEARIAMLSSRVAAELMQKALRAGVSLVLSYSRPTERALLLAREGGVGLACLSRDGGYYRFN